MGSRPTQVQLEALADFLEENPEVARGLLRTQQGKQQMKRKWSDVAASINALGGVIKDGAGWSKYWAEKKCALKKLCAQQTQSVQRTGGGSQDVARLAPLELRLVATIGGPSFASRDPHVAVDPFPQRSESQSVSVSHEVPATSQVDIGHVPMETQPPLENISAPHNVAGTSSRRRRSREVRRSRSRLDHEVDRLHALEERRLEAESRASQALANSIDNLANAIKESSQVIANALSEIARRLPPPP